MQDRLERFITQHPLWVTVAFAAFLFFVSAASLAFFPSLVAILGLSLQSQAVAEPAIGTQTLLVVVVTGAVALTGLLLSIFQIRHRDQEILLSHAQNLNRAANDAARRIFGLAKSLIKLQQSVELLYHSFTVESEPRQDSSTASSTCSCDRENRKEKLPPMVEAACQKIERALTDLIEDVHEIRRDPNSLNLAWEIAKGMIERFGLPEWKDRFIEYPVTEEVHRPKSEAPFNPVVFVDVLEGLEVILFYLKGRSKVLEHLKYLQEELKGSPDARLIETSANYAALFALISAEGFTFYVLGCLSCMVPWDAEDPKAGSKAESPGESKGEAKEELSKMPGGAHPVDQIWRRAIQSAFVDPIVAALAFDKGEKERSKIANFLVQFLDVLRLPTDGVLSLRGSVRDFYLMANLWTKAFRDRGLDPMNNKAFLNVAMEFSEKYYNFKWPKPGGNPGRHDEEP